MVQLVWDQTATRLYETGIDKGVLYLPSGTAVAWNGLTSIDETLSQFTTESYYLDGIKYYDRPVDGDFEAEISAITYPVEFDTFDGFSESKPGLFLDDQPVGRFGMSYRTLVGNDVSAQDLGYRIHILYNLLAKPTEREYSSQSDSPDLTEFSWNVSGIPESYTGFVPTAHIIADTTYLDPNVVKLLEDALYGTATTNPRLPLISEIVEILSYLIVITDNGDGSFTIAAPDSYVTDFGDNSFQIINANTTTIDADSYSLTNTSV